MRSYRIYIPLLLVILSIVLLTKNLFYENVIIKVGYNQLTSEAKKQVDFLIVSFHLPSDNLVCEPLLPTDIQSIHSNTFGRSRKLQNMQKINGRRTKNKLTPCLSIYCGDLKKGKTSLYKRRQQFTLITKLTDRNIGGT